MKTISVFIGAAMMSSSALACECAADSVENGMRESTYVFGAAVIRVAVERDGLGIKIANVANLKGEFKGGQLKTSSSRSGCGLTMRIPEKYVFFVDKDGFFSSCGATRIFGDADLGVLNDQVLNQWIDRARKASQ
ncbi:MAG: hypothetical protein JNN30_15220 [Rhodanobacteraceae bacterium]|nr:hypothetical protein [Rhodanobacteraceae bacterium]